MALALNELEFKFFIGKYFNHDMRYNVENHTSSMNEYRQVSNIRRTKSQHIKDCRTVLRLSLPNPLKPDVKSRMKM